MKSDIHTPINLGNPNEFTMIELAEVVSRIVAIPLEMISKPLPEDDPKQRRPDISKAKKELGWEPVVQLEEGILKTVKWFKDNGK